MVYKYTITFWNYFCLFVLEVPPNCTQDLLQVLYLGLTSGGPSGSIYGSRDQTCINQLPYLLYIDMLSGQ